jgi:hypothetical protein
MVREEIHLHLGYFPSRQLVVDAIEKCHILPDDLRHWGEEVRAPDHDLDWLVSVAKHLTLLDLEQYLRQKWMENRLWFLHNRT